MSLFPARPQGVVIPDTIQCEEPSYAIAEPIRRFFGKTGKWWGTWTSPQVKGGYDAILVIKKIAIESETDVAYIAADFPAWHIRQVFIEAKAQFVKREDGKTILRIPYEPARTYIDCWFEGRDFKGIMYGRFMVSRITWKLLQ